MKNTSKTLLICLPFYIANLTAQEVDLFELPLEQLLKVELAGDNVSHIDLLKAPLTNNASKLNTLSLAKSIEVITADTISARGLKNIIEVVENMTGVLVGESPSEPYSFSTRGFTRDSINVTYDGLSMGMATYNTRPMSTFNLKQVEFLKGPSEFSVGQGGAGGTINVITKKARKTNHHVKEVLVATGEYNSNSLNLGLSGPLSDSLMYRIDLSSNSSDGWVEQSNSESNNISSSLLWLPVDNLEVLFSLNNQQDKLPAYWGTPYIPESNAISPNNSVVVGHDNFVIDEKMRFINYNVADSEIASNSSWLRVDSKWQYSSDIEIESSIYQFSAERDWRNAENYLYNNELSQIERDRLLVQHERNNWGIVLKSNLDHTLFGHDSDTSLQFSYHNIDFARVVGFNLASPSLYWDAVDVYAPEAGNFGYVDLRQDGLIQSDTSFIISNNTKLSPKLNIQSQLKVESTDFDRRYINWDGTIRERATAKVSHSDISYFIGLSYEISDSVNLYSHFSQTHEPLFADYRFAFDVRQLERSKVQQIELGAKAISQDKNTEITFAIFSIDKNIDTQISNNVAMFESEQRSQGIDVSFNSKLSKQVSFATNLALVDASYGTFYDPEIGIQVDGNEPVNVPSATANVALSYLFEDLPIETGVKFHYVSPRWANSKNTVRLQDYTITKLFAAYHGGNYHVGLHINNLTDELYGPWSDIYYPNQVILAPPRLIELTFKVNF
ncbi:MAG: TonB-dependent receptor plug domain-containing protein [Gammaproteobacteria bacterium]|nr:TonB-dependent receptor plug domain-containing protein [Gammaproteobacteria bacterium]